MNPMKVSGVTQAARPTSDIIFKVNAERLVPPLNLGPCSLRL